MINNHPLDVIALGSCYVDTNVADFPFTSQGIPIEIELSGEQYEVVPGGSAVNFCCLGYELGLQTAFIGMTGDDLNGDTLKRLLEERGIQAALIRRPGLMTNIGFQMTSPEGKHVLLLAGTANAALEPAATLPKLEEVLTDAKMLYLGSCLKLKSFAHAFGDIADLAAQHSTKIVIDHGRVPHDVTTEMLEAVRSLVLRAQYYFPSREEFCKVWDVPNIEKGLQKLQSLAPNLVTVVKDGANGAFYWEEGSMKHVEAEKVDKVINATGAGDSFNAGVIAALTKNQSLSDAVAYGCRVAALKIQAKKLPSSS